MTFSIRSLAIQLTGVMAVRNASGEAQYDADGKPVTITLHSPASKAYQRAKHAADERNNTRAFGRLQGKSEAKPSSEDRVSEQAEFLAACTVSLDGFEVDGGAGHEAYKALYADLELGHIADDVAKFLAERSNFLKLPTKS